MELARRVESDPRVPVELVGFGQQAALLLPGGADTGGVVARRTLERVEREVPAALLLPAEFASGKRGTRICVDTREFLRRDPVGGWQVHRDRLRDANVAGLGCQTEARASILDGQVALRDQGGEERRAGLRRRLAREPDRFRVPERDVAVALAAILHPKQASSTSSPAGGG